MGTEAAVQIQGSHRLTKKHRGQGLTKPREPWWCKRSHTARRAACLAGGQRQMEREARRRPRRQAPLVQGIPAKVVSHPRRGLQRPLHAALRQAAPSSHSGAPLHGARTQFPLRPRGSLCARTHKKDLAIEQIRRWHHKFRVTVVFETLL